MIEHSFISKILQGILALEPELSMSLVATVVVTSLMFYMCVIGSMITSKIAEVGEVAYNAQWSRYPHSIQKCIMPIVKHSQQTIDFHGYHIVICNLEVFMKVSFYYRTNQSCILNAKFNCEYYLQIIKSAFSYYMMVRRFKSNIWCSFWCVYFIR